MLFVAFRSHPVRLKIPHLKHVEASYVESIIGILSFPSSGTVECGVRGGGTATENGVCDPSLSSVLPAFIHRLVNSMSSKYIRPIVLSILPLVLCFCDPVTTISDILVRFLMAVGRPKLHSSDGRKACFGCCPPRAVASNTCPSL